jgi:hypothetical protein
MKKYYLIVNGIKHPIPQRVWDSLKNEMHTNNRGRDIRGFAGYSRRFKAVIHAGYDIVKKEEL